jgi:hypothetical protein
MPDNSYDIPKIDASSPLQGLRRRENEEKGKRHGHEPPPKKDAREYFHTLEKAAEKSNDYCAKKGLPYRFRVYQKDNDVFIDILVLDKDGNVIQEKRKNISHEDFARLIDDVTNIEGLFFDGMA